MNSSLKVLIIDVENIFFPAEEIYQDALNLAFADVTKGKVRFDKNNVKNILLGNSFMDIVEFAISFKPTRIKITEEERKLILRKFVEYTERFLLKGKYAGTNQEHLEILRWFSQAEMSIVFCSNMRFELLMKYLDAAGYAAFADFVITPDRMKEEYEGSGFPKPSKEMYMKIMNIYGSKLDDYLCLEGTLGGTTACKFSNLNYIFCNDAKFFRLKEIKKALEKMELITFQ